MEPETDIMGHECGRSRAGVVSSAGAEQGTGTIYQKCDTAPELAGVPRSRGVDCSRASAALPLFSSPCSTALPGGGVGMATETIELHGHIIDSLILPKVLDEILNQEGTFEIEEICIGRERTDASYARVRVSAATGEQLSEILSRIKRQGAELVHE